MKRSLSTIALVVLCLSSLRADLSFTQTTTLEGGAAMMGPGAGKPVTIVTRIKGTKARSDIQVMDMKMSSITDLATKEVIFIDHANRTAQVFTPGGPKGSSLPMKMTADVTFKPTGETKTIDGVACEGHTFRIAINMADPTGQNMPPQAAEMMKDVKMALNGSVWIAKSGPAAAEYIQFQKAAAAAKLDTPLSVLLGGQRAGAGMDKTLAAVSAAPGLPYLTEVAMSVEGTGQMADIMRMQMKGMKTVQKISDVSTAAVPDDLFKAPPEYKLIKP